MQRVAQDRGIYLVPKEVCGVAFIREKRKDGRPYYYLVENRWENGHVRQKVVRYVGTKRPRGRQKGLKGLKGQRWGSANVRRRLGLPTTEAVIGAFGQPIGGGPLARR